MAGPTRLELATSCVTGRRSNRLNYGPAGMIPDWWAVRDLNTRPSGCKPDALTAELTALSPLRIVDYVTSARPSNRASNRVSSNAARMPNIYRRRKEGHSAVRDHPEAE